MVIYSYPMEKKEKQISYSLICQKEKSTGTLGMYFTCFGPFGVQGMINDASNDDDGDTSSTDEMST